MKRRRRLHGWMGRVVALPLLFQLSHDRIATAQLTSGQTIEGACPNAILYGNPVCENNGTLHIGSGWDEPDLSCSSCDCPDGWMGVDCGRCSTVSVCPEKVINGSSVPASNCTSDSLIPTDEESEEELGKVYSCSCGGGGDAFTELLCPYQPNTFVEFTVKGPGTDASPAFMSFTLFAGVESAYREDWEGEHTYYYPVIFEGNASNCKLTRGDCLEVDDVDFGDQSCVRFDCEDTVGSCPPENYTVCDGFPDCYNEDGLEYQVNYCTAAPTVGKDLTIACVDEQVNGTYICFYQQPNEFAPLSMTCSVGSCLYAESAVLSISTRYLEEALLGLTEQALILVASVVGLILLFVLFAVMTDWGSARRDTWSCCLRKKVLGGKARDFDGPYSDVGLLGAGADATSEPSKAVATIVPAFLEWKDLSYAVSVSQGGGGALNLLKGCRCSRLEMSVLSNVSGFVGPRDVLCAQPPTAVGPSAVSGSASVSSSLSASGRAASTMATAPAAEGSNVAANSVSASDLNLDQAPAAPVGPPSEARPSTMTGILGASGAGKSTLLDLLAGRKRAGEGRSVGHVSLLVSRVGGKGRVCVGPGEVRRVSGYVPQEDVLPGTLTCYEHLMFHASLRMPRQSTHGDRRQRALTVLEELGLTRVGDTRIGDAFKRGISGGEKRRLSIAAELMARPPLLFLDEPTTGLDAASALRVTTLLKGVAARGTTVLCSLHQPRPRVLNLLDSVMLLSGGRVAYFGAPGDAAIYFAAVGRPFPPSQPHPADAMLALACQQERGALPALFERSGLVQNGYFAGAMPSGTFGMGSDGQARDSRRSHYCTDSGSARAATDVEAGTDRGQDAAVEEGDDDEGRSRRCWRLRGRAREYQPAAAGFFGKTIALSRRLLLRAVRNPLLLVLHFGGSIAMALCLGTIFRGELNFDLDGAQSRLGALFFLLLYLSLMSLTSLPVWREDRRLFLTETMGRAYGHLPYFISVALTDILLVRVVPPVAFSVIAYPLMGLNSYSDGDKSLFWFAWILVLVNVACALGAMGIGALGLPLDLSNLLGGAMVLLFTLFGRFLLNSDGITEGWQWVTDVTPLGYAYEALLVNEFNDPLGERAYTIEGSECSADLPTIQPLGGVILETFGFNPDLQQMKDNVESLAIVAVVFGVISFVIFYFFTRTSPLKVRTSDDGSRCLPFRPTSASLKSTFFARVGINNSSSSSGSNNGKNGGDGDGDGDGDDNAADVKGSAYADDARPSPDAADASASEQDAGEEPGPQPLLLSWEDIRFTIPSSGRDWCRGKRLLPSQGSSGTLTILDDVSAFAGWGHASSNPVPNMTAEEDGSSQDVKRDSSDELPALDSTSGGFRGSVTAIMGPSGAGKTSLLNILAGRQQVARGGCLSLGKALAACPCPRGGRVTGAVRINNSEVGATTIKAVSGYVTQEDTLPETLTCFEHLMFHATLRMSRQKTSRGERTARVMEVLRALKIEDIKGSMIGGGLTRGISGGEKRRLSIATELLTRPGLLFLDEPTTGLDSSTALITMELLADVASQGTTIVCSLHQPRPQVYKLLDRVLLMSRGHVAFFGSPFAAGEFFASVGHPLDGGRKEAVDEADAMLDVIGEAESMGNGDDGQYESHSVVMPREVLRQQVLKAEAEGPPPLTAAQTLGAKWGCGRTSRTPPMITQLRALTGRAFMNVARDPYLAALHLLLMPLVGFLMASLVGDLTRYNESTAGVQGRLGAVFFLLLFLSFLGLTSLAAWVKQMTLFRHERTSGAYGAAAHLSTSFLADAIVCRVIPPIILAVIVRPGMGLRSGSLPGLIAGLVVFNLSLAAVLSACGTGAKSAQEALAMGCLVVLFSALLSGFLLARDDLPNFWEAVVWASPIAHAFEAIVANEFGAYGDIFKLSTVINDYPATTPYLSGDDVLSCFGLSEDRFVFDLALLAAIGAAGLLLAYFLLKCA